MATITDIQEIRITNIQDPEIQDLVKKLQQDLKNTTDTELQEDGQQEDIDQIYDMVKSLAPTAITKQAASPCLEAPQTSSKEKDEPKTDKKKDSNNTKKKTKKTKKKERPKSKPKVKVNPNSDDRKAEREKLNKKAQHCKLMLRKHYEEMRKLEDPKSKPTRYQKIKNLFASIGNQIPDKLKNNLEVQQETEKILLRAHRQIIDAFGMSKLKAQKDQQAIKEKYDQIAQRLSK